MSCPNCKSENIKYFKKRQTAPGEDAGEILCVCQDCGNKWKRTQKKESSGVKPVNRPTVQTKSVPGPITQIPCESAPKNPEWTKQERILQRILAVLLWPVTVSYWFYENRAIGLKKQTRIGVICATWLVVLASAVGLMYLGANQKPRVELDYSVSTTVIVSTAQPATTTAPRQTTTRPTTTVNSIFS